MTEVNLNSEHGWARSGPIIAGFDGSAHGQDALILARGLSLSLSLPLIVVTAYTPEEWLWAPGTAQPIDEKAREAIADQVRALIDDQDAVEHRIVPSPSAAGALHAEAERVGAQLIVVGSTHRRAMGRIVLGTVTQEVLDAAPCAIAVAPTGFAGRGLPRFSTIGVGFDDTPEAHHALAVARSLAADLRAELRLFWAAHLVAQSLPMAFMTYVDPKYFEEVREDIRGRLERAAAEVHQGLRVSTKLLNGPTVGALVKKSEKLDLLILGSRGYGPLKRVLLGSISRQVINDARCPVLVVPRGAEVAADAEHSHIIASERNEELSRQTRGAGAMSR